MNAVYNSKNGVRVPYFVTFLIGLILIAIIFFTVLQKAQHKNFWLDETYEIAHLCERSMGEIIGGFEIDESNKNPLYFALQKLVLSNINTFDSSALIKVRSISIFSAIIVALVLYILVRIWLGLFLAAFIVVSVASQNLFYHFAAESRVYMFWVMLFTMLVLTTSALCLRSYDESKVKYKIFFGLSAIAVTLVIATGIFQSVMSIMTCLFCWYFLHDRPRNLEPITHFAVPLILICVGTELYYALQSIEALGPLARDMLYKDGPYDLSGRLQQGDFSLLKMPARLLFPKAPRDAYFGAILANLFVLLGMGMPFLKWRQRYDLDKRDFFVLVLSITVLFQIASTILIMAVITFFRFYFVQRYFLNLIICHALLATAGVYFATRFNKKVFELLMKMVLLILFALSLNWHWGYCKGLRKDKPIIACEPLAGKLDYELPDSKEYSVPIRHKLFSAAARIGAAVKTSQRINECGWEEDANIDKVYMWEGREGELHVSAQVPLHGEPSKICDRPVYFRFKS